MLPVPSGRPAGRAARPRARGVDRVVRRGRAARAAGPDLRRTPGSGGWWRARTGTRSAGRCCRSPGRRCGRIGRDADVVTVVSRYTRGRFAAAFGPDAALEPLPPGVDAEVFRPDPQARAALRRRYGLGDAPVVTCVSRLVAAQGPGPAPARAAAAAGAGAGDAAPARRRRPGRRAAAPAGRRARASPSTSSSPGPCPPRSCPRTTRSATCSRCPAAPAAAGWTSRAWGSSCWRRRPRACRWWRATPVGPPETVRDGVTGHVVGGRDTAALADTLAACWRTRSGRGGWVRPAGEWMLRDWAMAGAGAAAARPALGPGRGRLPGPVRDRASAVRPAGGLPE